MKKVIRIDANGFFIEDVLIENNQIIPNDCIEQYCQEGFFKPKWNGVQWIEGLTLDEINAIKNVLRPKTEIEILQSQLKDVKQMLSLINQSNSDFIDYVFASIPDLQQ